MTIENNAAKYSEDKSRLLIFGSWVTGFFCLNRRKFKNPKYSGKKTNNLKGLVTIARFDKK